MPARKIADQAQTVCVILPTTIVEALDRLAVERNLEAIEGNHPSRVTRSEMIRMALELGLQRLREAA